MTMTPHKVTRTEAESVTNKFWKVRKDLHDLRLGQYLMNCLVPTEACPEIFYEKDPTKALQLFYEKYVITNEDSGLYNC
jgi:hypothetical protein